MLVKDDDSLKGQPRDEYDYPQRDAKDLSDQQGHGSMTSYLCKQQ